MYVYIFTISTICTMPLQNLFFCISCCIMLYYILKLMTVYISVYMYIYDLCFYFVFINL